MSQKQRETFNKRGGSILSKVTSQVSQTLKSVDISVNLKILADFCHNNFREAEGLEAIFGWVDHGCHGQQEMKIGGSQSFCNFLQ